MTESAYTFADSERIRAEVRKLRARLHQDGIRSRLVARSGDLTLTVYGACAETQRLLSTLRVAFDAGGRLDRLARLWGMVR